MWPFRNKNILPGVEKDNKGNLILSLTDEEQISITKQFDLLKTDDGEEILVHSDAADELKRGWTSLGLFYYAKDQVLRCDFEQDKTKRTEMIDKAIASITKAYSLFPLPIYLYDLAYFMEMNNKHELAKEVFKSFLQLQEEFKPTSIQNVFLNERDIDAAVEDAMTKVF